jgi:hypothetical protein
MLALSDRVTDDFVDYSQKQQYNMSTLSIVLAHNNILWQRKTQRLKMLVGYSFGPCRKKQIRLEVRPQGEINRINRCTCTERTRRNLNVVVLINMNE